MPIFTILIVFLSYITASIFSTAVTVLQVVCLGNVSNNLDFVSKKSHQAVDIVVPQYCGNFCPISRFYLPEKLHADGYNDDLS